MFFKSFRGKLFENGKRYAKSGTTIQKALEERIPNHILHVQFERKTTNWDYKEVSVINSLRGDAITRIVYGRTDGRTDGQTDNGVSHKLDWSRPVELKTIFSKLFHTI